MFDGSTKLKVCIDCDTKYYGTQNAKYCIDCKVIRMTKVKPRIKHKYHAGIV